jgi:release factor glutamine methyltransferase
MATMDGRPGAIALEIGATQGEAVSELVRGAGYSEVEVRKDLAGHDRVVIGR